STAARAVSIAAPTPASSSSGASGSSTPTSSARARSSRPFSTRHLFSPASPISGAQTSLLPGDPDNFRRGPDRIGPELPWSIGLSPRHTPRRGVNERDAGEPAQRDPSVPPLSGVRRAGERNRGGVPAGGR